MPRKPIEHAISPEWLWLTDRFDEARTAAPFIEFSIEAQERELWTERGPTILETWIRDKPGTRPSLWWKFDAPRLREIPAEHRNSYFAGDLIEPRLLLSGAGRPAHEALNIVPRYHLGVPVDWSDFDSENPPTFETQYAYLQRHGLLAPGEKPAKVEPEVTLATYWGHR